MINILYTKLYTKLQNNHRRYFRYWECSLQCVGNNACDSTTWDQLDCNLLKIQPNLSIPELQVTDILNGGNLQAGIYQFAQYANAKGKPYSSL